MPSPVGETEGAAFFSRDAQRTPSVWSTTPQAVDRPVALRLTTRCPTTNCPTTKPRVPRQVVFELIPDDELEKALGNPQEYQVDGDESIFDWPEITSLSSLEFPEDRMNEGEGLGWGSGFAWLEDAKVSANVEQDYDCDPNAQLTHSTFRGCA